MDIQRLLMVSSDFDLELRRAADHGDYNEVQRLLAEDANINSCSEHGVTALHLATASGHSHIVETLIDNEAHLDTTNQNGQTALHLAALRGDLTNVELLVDAGVDINTTTQFSQMTALHLAAKEGHDGVCRFLISNGCDVNITDQIDKPAYFYAANDEIRLMLQTQNLRKVTLADQYSRKINLDTASAKYSNSLHDEPFEDNNSFRSISQPLSPITPSPFVKSQRNSTGKSAAVFAKPAPPVLSAKKAPAMPPARKNDNKNRKMSSASKVVAKRQSIKSTNKPVVRKKSVKRVR